MNKKNKVSKFLYTSSLIAIVLSGYSLQKCDFIDSTSYILLANGLYQISKSITATDKEYTKNLKLYETSTKLGSISCLLIPDVPYQVESIITHLFIGGIMYLYSEIYKHEKKQF